MDLVAVFSLLVVLCGLVSAKPTLYQKNENDKLEPVLVPVSSTVIPLPVYRVEFGVGISDGNKHSKLHKPEGPISLITVNNKKKIPQQSNIKQISKEEFTKQP